MFKNSVFRDNKAGAGEKAFTVVNYLFLLALAVVTIFPLINILAISFSSSRAIVSGEVSVWPVEFNFQAYANITRDGQIFTALRNTVIVTLAGTSLNMIFTILAAYPLSKKRLMCRKGFTWFIMITMLFSGGLIPNFLLVKSLKMMDTYWALWLPPLISVYNMIILKTFFEGIPESLEEAASIDGASDPYILFRIILPVSMPVLATLTLFYAVGMWNNYMNPLLYITSSNKQLLMVKLMQMIANVSDAVKESGEGATSESLTPEAIKAATIVVSTVPIMCVYPFLQKYFVKGVMIGSIKG